MMEGWREVVVKVSDSGNEKHPATQPPTLPNNKGISSGYLFWGF